VIRLGRGSPSRTTLFPPTFAGLLSAFRMCDEMSQFEKGEADGTYRILGVLEVARVGGPAPVRSKGTVADAPDSRAGV